MPVSVYQRGGWLSSEKRQVLEAQKDCQPAIFLHTTNVICGEYNYNEGMSLISGSKQLIGIVEGGQALAQGIERRLGAAREAQLGQDAAHVAAHCPLADR